MIDVARPHPAAIVVENLAPLVGVLFFGWSVAPVMVVEWDASPVAAASPGPAAPRPAWGLHGGHAPRPPRPPEARGSPSPMMFVKESRIAAPPEAVFAFHESPGALQRLIPPWEHVEVEQQADSIRPGARVVLVSHLGPIPMRWVAEHTVYEPPHRFADRQVSGPFARWDHAHLFLDDGRGGTILRDEVDYDAPLGLIGRLLGDAMIRHKLQNMFDYRHEVTRRALEPGEPVGDE